MRIWKQDTYLSIWGRGDTEDPGDPDDAQYRKDEQGPSRHDRRVEKELIETNELMNGEPGGLQPIHITGAEKKNLPWGGLHLQMPNAARLHFEDRTVRRPVRFCARRACPS